MLKNLNTPWAKFLIKHTPVCKEIVTWASKAQEKELTLKQRILMRLHFLVCIWCERYAKQLRLLRLALHKAASKSDPASYASGSLSEAAKDRLKANLRKKQ